MSSAFLISVLFVGQCQASAGYSSFSAASGCNVAVQAPAMAYAVAAQAPVMAYSVEVQAPAVVAVPAPFVVQAPVAYGLQTRARAFSAQSAAQSYQFNSGHAAQFGSGVAGYGAPNFNAGFGASNGYSSGFSASNGYNAGFGASHGVNSGGRFGGIFGGRGKTVTKTKTKTKTVTRGR